MSSEMFSAVNETQTVTCLVAVQPANCHENGDRDQGDTVERELSTAMNEHGKYCLVGYLSVERRN